MQRDKHIGIITFQRAHNYGAILQVLSLQEILKNYCRSVSVIDYYPQSQHYYHYAECYTYSLKHPLKSIKNLLYLRRRKKRYYAFNSFIESYLNLTSKSLQTISQDYDTIVIGSDQVWNLRNSSGKYDYFYWGQFKQDNLPNLISYAASMGSCDNVQWAVVANLLKNFNAISVREKYLKDYIKSNCNFEAEWVLDPTLLQSKAFFEKIAKEPSIKNPYLFYYQARANKSAYLYAKKWAKKMNLKFICLSAHIMLSNSHQAITAGPSEFLGYIKKATYVLTSSFHGTVFCCHFKKNFSTLKLNDGDNGRSESLLELLGLDYKLISLDSAPNTDIVQWNEVDIKLNEARNDSVTWLVNHL